MERFKKVCVCANISIFYGFGKLIGKGNFAKVHIAKKKANEQTYAIKTIEKVKLTENPKNLASLEKEIEILRRVDHPNVIKLYEVYENDLYVHLILEYLKGGELFQLIQKKGIYSEKDASIAIKCLLSALAYCHQRNIIHRDLKPENLILVYNLRINFIETPPVSQRLR
jgi:calcium-dependent protein kinase